MAAKLVVGLAVVGAVLYMMLVGIVLAPLLTIQVAAVVVSTYLAYRVLLLGWPALWAGRIDLTTRWRTDGPIARIVGVAVTLLGLMLFVPAVAFIHFWWTR